MIIPLLSRPPLGAPALGAWTAKRRPAQPGAHPRYGMTSWFRVVVTSPTGEKDLGRWSGCSGLGVDLTVEDVWSGGENGAPYLVPTSITYPRIVLERAMDHTGSEQVQVWLRHVARRWHDSDEGGAGLLDPKPGQSAPDAYTGSTVIISLFDSSGEDDGDKRELGRWELSSAFPVAWSAPVLNSKSGTVALERLTLVHRGFLGGDGLGESESAGSGGNTGRFVLSDGKNPLEFQYNPGEVTVERRLEGLRNQSPMIYNNTDSWRGHNDVCFRVQALTIEGVTAVRDKARTLWDWLKPDEGSAAATGKGHATAKRLTLRMGSEFSEAVHLQSVEVRYTRFTRAGVPCRAVVTLTVVGASDERSKPGGSTPTGAPTGGGTPPQGGAPTARGGPGTPGRSATTDDLPPRGSDQEDALLRKFRRDAASSKGGSR